MQNEEYRSRRENEKYQIAHQTRRKALFQYEICRFDTGFADLIRDLQI